MVPGHIEPSAPARLALAGETLWVTHAVNEGITSRRVGYVAAVDVRTNRPVGAVRLPTVPSAIAVDGRDVWVALKDSDEVRRIDSVTYVVRQTIPVGDAPTAILVAFGHVWVANELDGTVWKLDAASGRVVARIQIGHRPRGLAASADRLWVTVAR
jgi:YVTN family beta-propeller protein